MVNDTKIFADISILVDYCSTYREEAQEQAELTLEGVKERDGKIIISKETSEALISRIADRHRILSYLVKKATQYLKEDWEDDSNPNLESTDINLTTKYRAEILNATNLKNELEFNIARYHGDVDILIDLLEEKGLEDFRNLLDDYLQACHGLRVKLDAKIIDDRFTSNREYPLIEASLQSIVKDEVKAKSVLEAALWHQETRNPYYLSSSSDYTYKRRNRINKAIASDLADQSTLNIFSPKEFIKEYIDENQYDPASISS